MNSSFVLVSLGSYNKCYRLGGLNSRLFFFFSLTVLETGKSKIKELDDSVVDRNPLPSLQIVLFSFHPHMAETMGPLSFLIKMLFTSRELILVS